jgi:hypothetical protein
MSIVDRVRNICVTPATEWPVIENESTAPADLVVSYLAPLAAIGAIAGFIGSVFLTSMLPFGGMGLFGGLVAAVVGFVMIIVMCFLIAFIVNVLAPTFSGRQDFNQAFKATVYAYTPALVAGVAQIIPILGGLVAFIASLYSLYVLYLGLPYLMKAPKDKAPGYVIVVAICALVAGFIIFGVMGMFIGAGLIGSRLMMG